MNPLELPVLFRVACLTHRLAVLALGNAVLLLLWVVVALAIAR